MARYCDILEPKILYMQSIILISYILGVTNDR